MTRIEVLNRYVSGLREWGIAVPADIHNEVVRSITGFKVKGSPCPHRVINHNHCVECGERVMDSSTNGIKTLR